MKLIDLTGQTFNRLTVLGRSPHNTNQNKPKWICRCECGKIVEVGGYELKSGNTKSCGCWNKEVRHTNPTTHGLSKTRLYRIWRAMKERCYNPHNKRYKHYGGRGIKVCDEWRNDFMVFREWALKNGYDETAPYGQCTIERVNNDEGYFPFNCVWTTLQEQAWNKQYTISSHRWMRTAKKGLN